ncbi:DMT family transporter [Rhabdaerophilum calidifontis]|jgi:drug/metabolite transporter (DMT)-like permease|uniref:DMT family transporter n=1 Tax=Rhabdaerophilum calidifontis TaxID=2604328 RepID=UPI001239E8FC|nr:DMT family transporter [Rhabdaerophilum calidifontis]
MLWAVFTILAAAAQTLRNALQRDLTARLGVTGATHVRFLFGFPFALLFLAGMVLLTGETVPPVTPAVLPPVILAALAQIGATALMLAAMKTKSFVVATAYTKTEPVLVALFGLIVLGDALSPAMAAAIAIATFGVMLTAWPERRGEGWSLPALGLGLLSAALFAIAAIGFRAGIRALPSGGFGIRASTILALGLFVQSAGLTLWLGLTDRPALRAILALWRPSLFAGFMGAAASQLWFLGFALTSAAKVRTLALVEVFFARIISGKMFREAPSRREGLGLALIVLGVALLLNSG